MTATRQQQHYESIAGTVMAHAHELPDDHEATGPMLTVQHDGLTLRCRPSRIAAEHMAGKLYRAKPPRRDRRPTKGGLTPTEIEDRALRYAAFLQANAHSVLTLWPAAGRRCDQVRFECALLGRLTGYESAGRASPEAVRQLAAEARHQGYTIRYADPEGVEPPR